MDLGALRPGELFVHTDDEVAHDAVGDAKPAIQLRGSPKVSSTFAVKSVIETTSMFDSKASRKWRIGPAVPSTGPVVVA